MVPDIVLRRALQFAVDIAVQRHHARPRQPYPSALRGLLRKSTLAGRDLAAVRAAVDGDDDFRAVVAAKASVDLVDPAGLAYLRGGAGWQQRALDAMGSSDAPASAIAQELTAERRRRIAAEDALQTARSDAEHAQRVSRAQLDDAIARLAGLNDQLAQRDRSLSELAERAAALTSAVAEREARIGAGETAAASMAAEVEALRGHVDSLRAERDEARAARDAALVARAASHALAERAAEAGDWRWHDGLTRRQPPRRRTPLPIPGGLLGDSRQATEHLLRADGAAVVVDGYNLAKSIWPGADLGHQRTLAIELFESLASRWGLDVAMVFDGASVVGAAAPARRKIFVEYSPEGVIADDVIVAWVQRIEPEVAVVVVTDDRELVSRVRRLGANTVSVAAVAEVAMR